MVLAGHARLLSPPPLSPLNYNQATVELFANLDTLGLQPDLDAIGSQNRICTTPDAGY